VLREAVIDVRLVADPTALGFPTELLEDAGVEPNRSQLPAHRQAAAARRAARPQLIRRRFGDVAENDRAADGPRPRIAP
jgi:hypothetical protein